MNMLTLIDKRISALEKQVQELRDIVKTPVGEHTKNISELAEHEGVVGDAICELSEDIETRISDVENAICELSEQ